MGFIADVREVLIASPGDVCECRKAARGVIRQWNEQDGKTRKLLLLPRMWEHHTYPTSQSNGQEAINKQLLPDCDFAIAVFGNKLGTETDRFASGTVEEIEQMKTAGRPVMIYFSSAPVDRQARNNSELDRLKAFQKECQSSAYYATYSDVEDFRGKLTQHLRDFMNEQMRQTNNSKAMKMARNLSQEQIALLRMIDAGGYGAYMEQSSGGKQFYIGAYPIACKSTQDSTSLESKFRQLIRMDLLDRGPLNGGLDDGYAMGITEFGFDTLDKLKALG